MVEKSQKEIPIIDKMEWIIQDEAKKSKVLDEEKAAWNENVPLVSQQEV
jgi:hypothetical protein